MDRKIRAFLAIVDEGTLTAAAAKVGLAQPSLTKVLQRLEVELGARLFHRKARGMELTAAGTSFLAHARRIEAEYGFAAEEIAAQKQGAVAVLRVGAGAMFHMVFLPRVIQRILEEFPKTRLDIIGDINRVTVPMLQRGELDLVCGLLDPDLQLYGIETSEAGHAEMGIVMRHGHPLAASPMTPDALADRDWILFQHDERMVKQLSRFMGDRPCRVAVATSSMATAMRLVSGSDYLMLAPVQLSPVIEPAGLMARTPSAPIDSFRTGFMFRRSSRSIPILSRLMEMLRAEVQAAD